MIGESSVTSWENISRFDIPKGENSYHFMVFKTRTSFPLGNIDCLCIRGWVSELWVGGRCWWRLIWFKENLVIAFSQSLSLAGQLHHKVTVHTMLQIIKKSFNLGCELMFQI